MTAKKSPGEELSDLISDVVHKERERSERYLRDLKRECDKARNEFRELQGEIATTREILRSAAYADLVRRVKAETGG